VDDEQISKLELTVSIVSAYVSKNSIPMSNLPDLVNSVHETLAKLSGAPGASSAPLVPAVPIKKSITPEYLVSLEDGRKLKSLKRHLSTRYGMTPEQYRAKWGLAADYPMVAPNYAQTRSNLARTMGLGRKASEPVVAPKPAGKRGRPRVPKVQ